MKKVTWSSLWSLCMELMVIILNFKIITLPLPLPLPFWHCFCPTHFYKGYGRNCILSAWMGCNYFPLYWWLAYCGGLRSPFYGPFEVDSGFTPLKKHVKLSLKWWTVPDHIFLGIPFHPLSPTITLTTDAFLMGWGAHTGHLTIKRLRSDEDRGLHINILELKTILLVIWWFLQILTGQMIAVRCNNTTTVSYVNKQGGTVSWSLCHLAMDIWNLYIQNSNIPRATHVLGEENIMADILKLLPFTNGRPQTGS